MLRIAANFATRQAQTERAALEGMKEQVQAEQFGIQITCKTQEPQNLNDAKQPGVVTDGWNLKKIGAMLPSAGFRMCFWLLHPNREHQGLCTEMPSER